MTGLALIASGWTPLLAIIVLAAAGPVAGPRSESIGPGLLFFFTAWPAIIYLLVGVVRVRRHAAAHPGGRVGTAPATSTTQVQPLSRRPAELARLRWFMGLLGVGLALHGFVALLEDSSRRAAASIVLGGAGLYWGLVGRMPPWFRC